MTINKDELISKIETCFNQSGYEDRDILENDEGAFNFIFKLTQEDIIRFNVDSLSNDSSDYWFQAEYFNYTLSKTIILDCDFTLYFNSIDDFVEIIFQIEEEIDRIEKIIGGK
jgi:hypothetical protein